MIATESIVSCGPASWSCCNSRSTPARPLAAWLALVCLGLVQHGGQAAANDTVSASYTTQSGSSQTLPPLLAGDPLPPLPAGTPSFRVETELFEGTQVKPQSQHLLLFDSGVIYDLPLGTGTTITVFDPQRSRVMLLHKTQRVRTSISTDSLIQISAQARAAAAESGANLGLAARVTQADSPDTYCIEFGGTKYTATVQPAISERAAAEYAAFTIWACRLNLARHVGSPPFARMTLADFLAAEKAWPRQIKLDVHRGLKTRTYRSENLYVGRLSDLDRKKISDVGQMITSYAEVDFAAFPAD